MRRRKPSGWWGQGRAPHKRWPGVTIPIGPCRGKYRFDRALAQKWVDFFPSMLKLQEAPFAGQPFHLLKWAELMIVRPLFGWVHARDFETRVAGKTFTIPAGARRFRRVFLYVPKKNTKSTTAAGIGLGLIHIDGEEAAQVGVAAADREQANVIFNIAKNMNQESPLLAERSDTFVRTIYVPGSKNTLKVLSADVKTKHGPNWHGVFVDEIHAHQNRELADTLIKGTAARVQPVIFLTTTAGEDEENSYWGEELKYARGVLNGTIRDETYLPILFDPTPAERENWTDPKVWARLNPSLGYGVRLESLAADCAAAQAEPRKQASFKRLNLNIPTKQETIWIPLEWWDACAEAIDEASLAGLDCFGGLDLSETTDLTAFALAFRRPDPPGAGGEVIRLALPPKEGDTPETPQQEVDLNINFTLDLLTWFWCPEATIHERARAEGWPYEQWAREGWLFTSPGELIDYNQAYRFIRHEIGNRFPRMKEIGCDPHNANHIAPALEAAGFTLTMVRQGPLSLSAGCKLIEGLVKAGRVRHRVMYPGLYRPVSTSGPPPQGLPPLRGEGRQAGPVPLANPVMRMCIDNCAVRADANGNIAPTKPHDRKRRIDGLSAWATAMNRLIAQPEPLESVYARRGIRTT